MANIEILEEVKETIWVKIPPLYNVVLHNDDKTTFEFVILILSTIFYKTIEEPVNLAHHIHENGSAVVGGPYTHEIALEKVNETISLARANGFPLQASLEETE